MKNLLIFLIVSSGFVCNVQGQEMKFGVKAGANFSNLNFSSDFGNVTPDGATSFYIGGLADVGFSEKLHIQPELLYSIEGAKDSDISFSSFTCDVQILHYRGIKCSGRTPSRFRCGCRKWY